jgi:hypothetical protein
MSVIENWDPAVRYNDSDLRRVAVKLDDGGIDHDTSCG